MIDVLLYALGVIVFTLGVAASIGLHEFGHLVPGKLFNVKVTQYFIGFGRTLWSMRRGETEYGLKAIPLGGYVKLVGMLPPAVAADGSEAVQARPTGMFAQLISDAKQAEYEHVEPHEHHRLFYRLPVWKRIVIMGSGVGINVLISFVLFAVVLIGYGVNMPTVTVGTVSQCVKVVTSGINPGKCTSSDPASPAFSAGLKPGDKVLEFGGHRIKDYRQLQDLIRAGGNEHTTILVERAGKPLTLAVSPVVKSVPSFTSDHEVRAGFLGITPVVERQRQGFGDVFSTMTDHTRATVNAITHLPQQVYHVGRAALGFEKRDPTSIMSVVGAGRIAGEVSASQEVSVGDRIAGLVLLLAGLNLFLGLVNLVPLPPFDGAGIATALVDSVRRRWARLRGKPEPNVFDSAALLPITYVMAVLLIAMSVVLIYADLVSPVSLS